MFFLRLKGKLLKKREEFRKIYQQGRSLASRYSVLYYLDNKDINSKVGISVSKKVGNSVVRHRIKRLYKEAFRLNYKNIKKGYDFVIIGRKNAINLNFHECEKDILYLFKKARLLIIKKE